MSCPICVPAELRWTRRPTLTVHVPPSANRWHRVVRGRPILSRMARLYTNAVALSAIAQGVNKIDAPTEIDVEIVWYRARKSGDVDKRGAVLLDALQGICYDNDSQIRRYSIERRDDDPRNARMEVTITPAAP